MFMISFFKLILFLVVPNLSEIEQNKLWEITKEIVCANPFKFNTTIPQVAIELVRRIEKEGRTYYHKAKNFILGYVRFSG